MKNNLYKKLVSVVLAVALLSVPFFSYAGNFTVNADKLYVRSGPGTNHPSAGVLYRNTVVSVTGETTGSDGRTWCSIDYSGGSGYVCKEYISEDKVYEASDNDFEAWLNDQGFPESYKNSLRGLHEKYPEWVFYAQHTGLEWENVVEEESKTGRNLIGSNAISSWKSTEEGAFDWSSNYWPGFDGASWVQASRELIEYYLDPRNFLTDPYIFEFQKQYYDSSSQTKDMLTTMLSGTFLDGSIEGSNSVFQSSSVSTSAYVISSDGPGSFTVSDSSSGPGSYNGPGSISQSNVNTVDGPGSVQTEKLAWWQTAPEDESKWIYIDSDGVRKSGGWYWLDGNHDGISECYYFYEDGIMAADTEIDGYYVNTDGKWQDESGNIQTKVTKTAQTAQTAQTESTGSETYADLIMRAAETSGVSPFVLTASILQEMGKDGKSESISGTNSKYPGIYNFYNISAYNHNGLSAVEAGLDFASQSGSAMRPWDTIEKAIIGGAEIYAENYLENGQDTTYLKKFNVQGTNLFNHQYMTYVAAASSEGAGIEDAYSGNIKSGKLEFKIPVYKNMPETPCLQPIKDGNPNNKLKDISVDGYILTPTFNLNTNEYTLIVEAGVSSVNISAETIDSRANVQGIGNTSLAKGENTININVTAQNGDIRTYKISIIRKDDGLTDSTEESVGPGNINPGNETDSPVLNDTALPETSTQEDSDVSFGPGGSADSVIVIGEAPG